jgi:hypothetical protein
MTQKSDHSQLRQYGLGVFIVMACFGYFFWISADPRATNNNHIGEIKTAMIAFVAGIIGFYFGSSQGGQKNADVIRNLVNPQDGSTVLKTDSPTETDEQKLKRLEAITNPTDEQKTEMETLRKNINI